MKELFHIEMPGPGEKEGLLSIRISEKHVGYSITDRTGRKLRRLVYYTVDEWGPEIENELLPAQSFADKIIVGYGFSPSILVESAGQHENNIREILQFSGDHSIDTVILEDNINGHNLRNIYAVPSPIHNWVKEKFPGATFIHDFSVSVGKNNPAGNITEAWIDFRNTDFTLIIWKDKKLLQATRLPYANPADVLYYLLRAFHLFSLSQNTTPLLLSGLIDRQSTLYTELYQYFLLLSFTEAGWPHSTGHPPHFFASFQKLATCAS